VLTLLLTSTPLTSSNMPHILPTAISLFSFLLFGFAFGQLGHWFGVRKRGWWLASLVVQLAVLLGPAVLVSTHTLRLGKGGSTGHATLLIGLLAAGAGAQVALVSGQIILFVKRIRLRRTALMSSKEDSGAIAAEKLKPDCLAILCQARTSSNPEIPTAMLTSPFIDLLTDPNFFAPLPLPPPFVSSHPFTHPRSRQRNVRSLYVFVLIGGCFIGAGIHKGGGTELVLWLSVGLRVAVVIWVVGLLPGGTDEARGGEASVEKAVGGVGEKSLNSRRVTEMREEESRRKVEPRPSREQSLSGKA
jgi:hypothetical protein